jgi:hypothetical protein
MSSSSARGGRLVAALPGWRSSDLYAGSASRVLRAGLRPGSPLPRHPRLDGAGLVFWLDDARGRTAKRRWLRGIAPAALALFSLLEALADRVELRHALDLGRQAVARGGQALEFLFLVAAPLPALLAIHALANLIRSVVRLAFLCQKIVDVHCLLFPLVIA